MESLLQEIRESYSRRFKNPLEQKRSWERVASIFTPRLPEPGRLRPSLLLAREAADLGLALVWIVQAALIRTLLQTVKELPDLSPALVSRINNEKETSLGALAHSEDPAAPVTVEERCDSIIVSGVKKYITGGSGADFILLTARLRGEEKISRLMFIPGDAILEGEMAGLDLGCLDTTSHGRLTLEEKALPPGLSIPLPPPLLRKHLKIWGTVERALIMEASAAYALELDRQLTELMGSAPSGTEAAAMEETLQEMIRSNDTLIAQAFAGGRVEPDYRFMGKLLPFIVKLKERGKAAGDGLPEDMKLRLRDLDFLLSMAGKKPVL